MGSPLLLLEAEIPVNIQIHRAAIPVFNIPYGDGRYLAALVAKDGKGPRHAERRSGNDAQSQGVNAGEYLADLFLVAYPEQFRGAVYRRVKAYGVQDSERGHVHGMRQRVV